MSDIKNVNYNGFRYRASKNYAGLYTIDYGGWFKIFTTAKDKLNVPHYVDPAISGIVDVNSLIPFGSNTVYEGHSIGDTIPNNLNDPEVFNKDRFNVRSLGFKTPFTHVGWGYDVFGFPAPNESVSWSISGVLSTGIPTNKFRTGSGVNDDPSIYGSKVKEQTFLAGPLDLRWDNIRKVWTSNANVFAAKVVKTTIENNGDPTESDFGTKFTYDVALTEGSSTGLIVTGIKPEFPPRPTDYKVFPLSTGSPCFLFTYFDGSRPKLAMMAKEKEDTVECSTVADGGLGDPGLGTDALYLDYLFENPLSHYYGGTGFGGSGINGYKTGQILVARHHESGFGRYLLQASTGISIDYDVHNPTGTISLSISNDVSFTFNSGVNNTITAISGLTTPLSISQGGTSATGKVWVDLTSTQIIDGLKQFVSGIRIPSGSLSNPGLCFAHETNYGLAYPVNNHFSLVVSGIQAQSYSLTSGIRSSFPNHIYLSRATDDAPLNVYAKNVFTGTTGEKLAIQRWLSYNGSGLAEIDYNGNIVSKGVFVNLIKPTGNIYNVSIDDYAILQRTSGVASNQYVVLRNAILNSGRELIIKDHLGMASINNIIVSGYSGQKIDGNLNYTLNSNYQSLRLICDGYNWFIV
jgi:hypothetical protein